MANIQIRIDEKEKQEAKKVLDSLGLDLSTAVRLFLKKVSITKGLPFLLLTENGFTREEEAEILQASEDAKKGINLSKAISGKEAVDYLDAL